MGGERREVKKERARRRGEKRLFRSLGSSPQKTLRVRCEIGRRQLLPAPHFQTTGPLAKTTYDLKIYLVELIARDFLSARVSDRDSKIQLRKLDAFC